MLVRENTDLARVRNYLVSNNMRARQLGGPKDFEEARHDIEQLPLLTDAHSVALHAHERLLALVPSVPKAIADQLKRRLKPEGPKHASAKPEAASLLSAFDEIYRTGPAPTFTRWTVCWLPAASSATTSPALTPRRDPPDRRRANARRRDQRGRRRLRPARRGDLSPDAAAHRPRPFSHDRRPPGQGQGIRRRRGRAARRPPLARNDEHRRLLYVALTRATRSWTLIAPSTYASPMLTLIP